MSTTPEPMAGEVWDVVLDPQVGREQAGYRPALVISNDFFNQAPNGLHYFVPITSRNRGLRYHIPIAEPEGGIRGTAVIMCDQAKSQSILRFRRYRGTVSDALLRRVQAMVGKCIDR